MSELLIESGPGLYLRTARFEQIVQAVADRVSRMEPDVPAIYCPPVVPATCSSRPTTRRRFLT